MSETIYTFNELVQQMLKLTSITVQEATDILNTLGFAEADCDANIAFGKPAHRMVQTVSVFTFDTEKDVSIRFDFSVPAYGKRITLYLETTIVAQYRLPLDFDTDDSDDDPFAPLED